MQSLPASITLNGANLEVGGHKTLEDALRASGIKPKPGDFVAVDGSVIEAGKGEPFHATVNGEVATEPVFVRFNPSAPCPSSTWIGPRPSSSIE